MPDPSHILSYEELQLEPDHTFKEQPVKILDSQTTLLRRKEIPMFLIQWSHRSAEEATWEVIKQMRKNYPKVMEALERDFGKRF